MNNQNEVLVSLLKMMEEEFYETEEGKLLQEQIKRMNRDCDSMFGPTEQKFAKECFVLIYHASQRKTEYAYRKGMTDCVEILKKLGVLA